MHENLNIVYTDLFRMDKLSLLNVDKTRLIIYRKKYTSPQYQAEYFSNHKSKHFQFLYLLIKEALRSCSSKQFRTQPLFRKLGLLNMYLYNQFFLKLCFKLYNDDTPNQHLIRIVYPF